MILRALDTISIFVVDYHEVIAMGVIKATSECEVERLLGQKEGSLEGLILHLSYDSF